MRALTEVQEEQLECLLVDIVSKNKDVRISLQRLNVLGSKAINKLDKVTYTKSDRWMDSEKGDALWSYIDEWKWMIEEVNCAIELSNSKSINIEAQTPLDITSILVVKADHMDDLYIHIPLAEIIF
ncbi:hypothetical protein AB4254_12260 [Vibrio breoganii]